MIQAAMATPALKKRATPTAECGWSCVDLHSWGVAGVAGGGWRPTDYRVSRREGRVRFRDFAEQVLFGTTLADKLAAPPSRMSDRVRGPERVVNAPARPPGLRDSWTAYYRALSDVAEQLMSVMAVALGLPHDHFAPMIDRLLLRNQVRRADTE